QDTAGQLQITDVFASKTFGNTQLVVLDVPNDGPSLFLNFDPTKLVLNFPQINDKANSVIAAGTPSAAEINFLHSDPQSFVFTVTSVQPVPNTTSEFALGLTTTVTPEPAAAWLVGLGLFAIFISRIGSRRFAR
ncbi:MAG: hypothetical protein ABI165_07710, partial [Bryobacteraceae bacterium]